MAHAHYREDIIEAIEARIIMEHPEAEPKMIFGHPGFAVNKRVFCFAYDDGLCLKLPRQDYQEILKSEEAEPFAPGGEKPMGTWAVLTYPDAQEYHDNWDWLEKALAYIVTDAAAPPKKKRKNRK